MAELAFDVIEQILVHLDVEDLIRCKSVCKLWQSFISTPRFVQSHLKHSSNNDLNNHELGHRRIAWHIYADEDAWVRNNILYVVGSCNGLVCISPKDAEFVLTNPLTRELKKLPTPPHPPPHRHIRQALCSGFGYDLSTDDYKVIAGFRKMKENRMLFHALTLKSNTWKFIGEVEYKLVYAVSGILCGGALHWFMSRGKKKVIMSLDLSTEEFKEIPQPPDGYKCYPVSSYGYRLGVIEDCLCIFWDWCPDFTKKWIMKNNKWQVYNDDHCENKYDVAHTIIKVDSPGYGYGYSYNVEDGRRVPVDGPYMRASRFVKSLVSPHLHDNTYENAMGHEDDESVKGGAKGNIRNRKMKEVLDV